MPLTKPLVIVLLGPTASGKTNLGIEIAELMKVEIHNIDSRQVYLGMDIGTAKPTLDQQNRVNHLLINLKQPNDPINVEQFQKEAYISLTKKLKQTGKALLVGGSGLYLKAITQGLLPPKVPPQPELRKQFNGLGQNVCHQLLQKIDPVASQRISNSDVVRTQRALEVIYATGQPISAQQSSNPPQWNVIELGLDPKNLRERITQRTKEIYQRGLIHETEKLIAQFGKELSMLQTIGYREAVDVIEGKLKVPEAIAITNNRTQKFAKRQRTWFRKQHDPKWLNDDEPLREAQSLIQSVLG